MTENTKSRRGVYYDLSKSPYEYLTPYGDLLKFSSKKKMEMYTRDIKGELSRLSKLVERHKLCKFITHEAYEVMERGVYRALYKKIEG